MAPSQLAAPFALAAFALGLGNPLIRVHPWTAAFLWCALALAERLAQLRREARPWFLARPGELLFLGSLTLYLATFRWKGGDDIPNSLLPFCILRHGTLSLEPLRSLFVEPGFKNDFTVEGPRSLLSIFPVASAVLALPVYLVPVLAGAPLDWELIHGLSKVSASVICALSVVVFHRAASRRASPGWAAGTSILYALGTYTFSVSSQALYQHGPGQLGVLLGLAGLWAEGPRPSADFLAGLGLGFAAAARVDAAFFLVAGAAVQGLRGRRRLLHFLLGAALPLLATAAYWLAYTGRLRPPESRVQANLFSGFQPEAVLGMLASPTRGLLFFTPACLFGLLGLGRMWRRERALAASLSAAMAATWALFCFRPTWTAGQTFGNRYFAVVSAVLALACAEAEEPVRGSPALERAWACAFALSVLVHACGAFFTWPGSFAIDAQRSELWRLTLWPPFALFSAAGALGAVAAPARWAAAGAFCAAAFGAGWAACRATCLRPAAARPR